MAMIFFSVFSCASTPEKKTDSMYVMVYDFENSTVMGVTIFIDGEEIGRTDIYGRLTYPCDYEREVLISAEKEGYETVETKSAIRSGTVLYFKMGSGAYYAGAAEKCLDETDVKGALKMIENALKIEKRKDWLFLKEVILRKVENAE